MSITLFAYSAQDQPVPVGDVERGLRELGWDVLFLEDWHDMTLAQQDILDGTFIACGWRYDAARSAQVRDAFARKDRAAIDQLYETSVIAVCELYSSERDESDTALEEDYGEMIESFASSGGRQDHVLALRNQRRQYSVRTSAGRSPFCVEFQEVLCWAVADVTGGLMQDIHEEYGFSRDVPLPQRWDESYSRTAGNRPFGTRAGGGLGSPPLWAIGWYSVFAILGIVLIALGKNPLQGQNWYVWLALLHGPLAFGLYRASRVAWYVSICLTVAALIMIPISILLNGGGARIVLPTLFYGYMLSRLLAEETKQYFR